MSRYLRSAVAEIKGRDAQLEKLLYQVLFRREARDRFAELFKEIEELYEILSPDPALADYIGPYNELADLFAMMQAAYGRATSFIGELAHKTGRLVQENASAHGLDRLTRPVEFDEGALSALRNRDATDEGKVVNLSRVLQAVDAETQPHLISIAERAASVMQSLDERQASTQQALEQLQALADERKAAEAARESSGLAPAVFTVFWELRRDGYPDNRSRELALEIESAYARFPNAADNPDEKRQLKAEIYKVLLKVVSGKKMIDLADRLMGAHSPQ